MLPAVSTSSQTFAAILDDLVRATALDPAMNAAPTPPPPPASSPKGTSLSPSEPEGDNEVPLDQPRARAGDGTDAGGVLVQRAAPSRLRGKGDLTLVIGLGGDAGEAAPDGDGIQHGSRCEGSGADRGGQVAASRAGLGQLVPQLGGQQAAGGPRPGGERRGDDDRDESEQQQAAAERLQGAQREAGVGEPGGAGGGGCRHRVSSRYAVSAAWRRTPAP